MCASWWYNYVTASKNHWVCCQPVLLDELFKRTESHKGVGLPITDAMTRSRICPMRCQETGSRFKEVSRYWLHPFVCLQWERRRTASVRLLNARIFSSGVSSKAPLQVSWLFSTITAFGFRHEHLSWTVILCIHSVCSFSDSFSLRKVQRLIFTILVEVHWSVSSIFSVC